MVDFGGDQREVYFEHDPDVSMLFTRRCATRFSYGLLTDQKVTPVCEVSHLCIGGGRIISENLSTVIQGSLHN